MSLALSCPERLHLAWARIVDSTVRHTTRTVVRAKQGLGVGGGEVGKWLTEKPERMSLTHRHALSFIDIAYVFVVVIICAPSKHLTVT